MRFFPGSTLGPTARRPAPAATARRPAPARPASHLPALAILGLLSVAGAEPAIAQTAPDPVLATVNGQSIHVSDLKAAVETLPPQARQMPPQQLYPLVLDQLVDAQALLVEARKIGLDKDPDVQRSMQMAEDRTLASAMLNKLVRPQVTDEAVRARYDQEFANKPGETEVHARHILVGDEATAKKIIAELKKGADFAALSKQYSKDPGASAQGGDLGFFKKGDMVPEFAEAAFALKDDQVTPVPVKTQFGWHVIQTLEHRTTQPPTFEQERDELRQEMAQAAVQKEVAQARSEVTVERFKLDLEPVRATDTAEPPPPSK
jgi:peptidyl-prolyl cis-trans isomerase C